MINKNKIGNFLGVISLMLLCAFLGTQIQKRYFDTKEVKNYVKTITKHTKTLRTEIVQVEKEVKAKEKHRNKLKEEFKKIVIPDTCAEIVRNYEQQLANCDSIVSLKDKIIFKTDSIVIYKDKIIDKLVIPKKPKIVTLGPQLGYNPFTNKVTFGIGATINIVSF